MLEYTIFPITGNSDNSVESQNNTTDKKKKIMEREIELHFIIRLY